MFRLLIIFLLLSVNVHAQTGVNKFTYVQGGIVRGDSTKKQIALVFTADEYGEGLPVIIQTLKQEAIKGSFFFTGRFYRAKSFQHHLQQLKEHGHYLGPHSDEHLLYCDWTKRDSLLVTRDSFEKDIARNMTAMIPTDQPLVPPLYFIPPYEWWNDSIAAWSKAKGLSIVNFTPGMRTNADYTWPELPNYKSSEWIINWLKETIAIKPAQLNGAIILIHAGTDPRRKDKLYDRLGEMIQLLKEKGYQLRRIDSLLGNSRLP